MCRECAPIYYDRPRCTSVDPKTGWQCGLWRHHVPKTHNPLVSTDAPWFGNNRAIAFAKLSTCEQDTIVLAEARA